MQNRVILYKSRGLNKLNCSIDITNKILNSPPLPDETVRQNYSEIDFWEQVALLAVGPTFNDPERPLKEGTKFEKLNSGLYYVKRETGLSLLLKYLGEGWCFASIMRDRTNSQILSINHSYRIIEVKAVKDFTVAINGKKGTIPKGYLTVKAIAI